MCLNMAAEFQSHDASHKLLYATASNKAVDDAALKYAKMYEDLPNEQHKRIIRVHSLKGEKAALMCHDKPDDGYHSRFGQPISDDLLHEFRAVAYVKTLQADYEDSRRRRDPRRILTEMSLSTAMWHLLQETRDSETSQQILLGLQKYGSSASSIEETTELKLLLNELMAHTIQRADAVFYTLNCASKVNLYQNFHAKLVIVDEACRASEISTMAVIAFYNPQLYILVGDLQQLRPTVLSAHHERYDEDQLVLNPFYLQALLSLLERLSRLGHRLLFYKSSTAVKEI